MNVPQLIVLYFALVTVFYFCNQFTLDCVGIYSNDTIFVEKFSFCLLVCQAYDFFNGLYTVKDQNVLIVKHHFLSQMSALLTRTCVSIDDAACVFVCGVAVKQRSILILPLYRLATATVVLALETDTCVPSLAHAYRNVSVCVHTNRYQRALSSVCFGHVVCR